MNIQWPSKISRPQHYNITALLQKHKFVQKGRNCKNNLLLAEKLSNFNQKYLWASIFLATIFLIMINCFSIVFLMIILALGPPYFLRMKDKYSGLSFSIILIIIQFIITVYFDILFFKDELHSIFIILIYILIASILNKLDFGLLNLLLFLFNLHLHYFLNGNPNQYVKEILLKGISTLIIIAIHIYLENIFIMFSKIKFLNKTFTFLLNSIKENYFTLNIGNNVLFSTQKRILENQTISSILFCDT